MYTRERAARTIDHAVLKASALLEHGCRRLGAAPAEKVLDGAGGSRLLRTAD
ncbi:MAG: hypothetical protein JXA90_03895 [Planctomycetes bacterium]|nr:hypothetical protein [Planctomycetota bacterium]